MGQCCGKPGPEHPEQAVTPSQEALKHIPVEVKELRLVGAKEISPPGTPLADVKPAPISADVKPGRGVNLAGDDTKPGTKPEKPAGEDEKSAESEACPQRDGSEIARLVGLDSADVKVPIVTSAVALSQASKAAAVATPLAGTEAPPSAEPAGRAAAAEAPSGSTALGEEPVTADPADDTSLVKAPEAGSILLETSVTPVTTKQGEEESGPPAAEPSSLPAAQVSSLPGALDSASGLPSSLSEEAVDSPTPARRLSTGALVLDDSHQPVALTADEMQAVFQGGAMEALSEGEPDDH